MVGEKLQAVDLVVLLKAVKLHPGVIIDVEISFLGNSKHHLVVEVPGGEQQFHKVQPCSRSTYPRGCLEGGYTSTYCTSLTVSLTWNSQPRFLVLQSMVAMCPSLPPINRCLQRTEVRVVEYCCSHWQPNTAPTCRPLSS